MYTAAELPVNERGAVYHLNLLPEELADTIITVGDPNRVALISCHFDSIEVKSTHREFVTHTGYLGKKRVSVISTGIGVPCIDIVMNELDALANIDLTTRLPKAILKQLNIIRLGTTGGLTLQCKPGDIFLSRYAVGFDTLLQYYQQTLSADLQALQVELTDYLAGESGPFYLAQADNALCQQLADIGQAGITATCGGFYGPQGRQLRHPIQYPSLLSKMASFQFQDFPVLNFEMETAGILGLANIFGHRAVSLSVVITNRITGEFTTQVPVLVEDLIQKALALVN